MTGFEYPTRWPQFYDALLSDDQRLAAVAVLDERDRALEQHFSEHLSDCGPFEYLYRWPQFYDALLSENPDRVREAVALLQVRDIDLETYLTNCCGGAGGGGLPESPPILTTSVKNGSNYCSGATRPPAVLEDNVWFAEPPSLIASGITYDLLNGLGIPVQPHSYTSMYLGDAIHFTFPPATNLHIHLKFNFNESINEGEPGYGDAVTRSLHMWIENGPGGGTGTTFAHEYRNYVGTREDTMCEFDVGPYDIPNTFTLHFYCLWGSVMESGIFSQNRNYYNDGDGFVVTGEL